MRSRTAFWIRPSVMTAAMALTMLVASPLFWATSAFGDRSDEDWFGYGGSKTKPKTLSKELGNLSAMMQEGGAAHLSPSQMTRLRQYFNELGENLGFKGLKSTQRNFEEFLGFLERLEETGGVGGKKGSQLQLTASQLRRLREIIEKSAAESGVTRQKRKR